MSSRLRYFHLASGASPARVCLSVGVHAGLGQGTSQSLGLFSPLFCSQVAAGRRARRENTGLAAGAPTGAHGSLPT